MFCFRSSFKALFLLIIFQLPLLIATDPDTGRILVRIIYEINNGGGQQRDFDVLKEELNLLGCDVEAGNQDINITPPTEIADINIFVEIPYEEYFPYAKQNYFIPNPECFYKNVHLIPQLDKILCRTKDVERIFSPLHSSLFFLGFTSIDQYDPKIKKDYFKFWHGPGKSGFKNTAAVVAVWKKRKDFPLLTIVHRPSIPVPTNIPRVKTISTYLSNDKYSALQNKHGVHLCPSFAEGYGHYIMEAMSTGAVVVTTNAPPMNEFIVNPDFLINYKKKQRLNAGYLYHVDLNAFEKTVEGLLKLSKADLKKIGDANRQTYLEHKIRFKERLALLIESYRESQSN